MRGCSLQQLTMAFACKLRAMRRRKLLAGGLPALVLGSGCLSILTPKDIPLYFVNNAGESFEVTATVSNQNSDEEVFNETINVPSGGRIERTLKNIKKGRDIPS